MVVMALKCRGEQILDGLYIVQGSMRNNYYGQQDVEEYSGLRVQPHKAIVGANAFSHEIPYVTYGFIKWLQMGLCYGFRLEEGYMPISGGEVEEPKKFSIYV
ncbi:hypothetical protein CASFOL_036952 [Castilleja foliolosa]|uniref:Uncharacterized protein n=1 Tax=Castilleja foliolosa TaxID=1961234 RepID=A0ABD3BRP0_9LAMI